MLLLLLLLFSSSSSSSLSLTKVATTLNKRENDIILLEFDVMCQRSSFSMIRCCLAGDGVHLAVTNTSSVSDDELDQLQDVIRDVVSRTRTLQRQLV